MKEQEGIIQMMSETYVECLVKRKNSPLLVLLKTVLIMLAVLLVLTGIVLWPALIAGALAGAAAYFVSMNADLEFEYLYLDREITVDKVMAKTKRKRVAKYDLERMEIFAPLNSYHLDDFKNRNVKTCDYSSGESGQPENRYAMYYDGGTKVILEPNADMVKAIKNIAPRKVFTD